MRLTLTLIAITACAGSTATSPNHGNTTPATHEARQTGELERGMANCPSAVPGAVTELAMTSDGVDVIIAAEDPAARQQIVSLAERHMRMGGPAGLPEHSGLHGGPGSIGHCPIIHDATRITTTRTVQGVIIHVRALVPGNVKALQDETRSRVAGLRAHAAC
jgi:hypothetical protein